MVRRIGTPIHGRTDMEKRDSYSRIEGVLDIWYSIRFIIDVFCVLSKREIFLEKKMWHLLCDKLKGKVYIYYRMDEILIFHSKIVIFIFVCII